jgi:hypothetical protein
LHGQFFTVAERRHSILAMVRPSPSSRSAFRRACLAVALALLAGTTSAAGGGLDPGQRLRLSPEQRREMWERMSPEQREAWRNARSQEDRQRAWQGFSPDQRREMWEGLSPEQREMMLRRLPPEQRHDMWRNMTPEQRRAMRDRFVEQRPPEPGAGPPARPMRHLSPEERQRLREQIREAQRDVYRDGRGVDRGSDGGRGRGRDGRR